MREKIITLPPATPDIAPARFVFVVMDADVKTERGRFTLAELRSLAKALQAYERMVLAGIPYTSTGN